MKKSVEVKVTESSEKVIRMKERKKGASQRFKARVKAIKNGELFTPDIAVRSLQPTAIKVENFKIDLGNKTVRLNRNGSAGTVLVISEKTEEGTVKTRKSFTDIRDAIKAFNATVKA